MTGWVANVILFCGLWWLDPRRRWPLLLTAAGEGLWAVHGYRTAQPDLTVICVLFAALSVRNYFRWGAAD